MKYTAVLLGHPLRQVLTEMGDLIGEVEDLALDEKISAELFGVADDLSACYERLLDQLGTN